MKKTIGWALAVAVSLGAAMPLTANAQHWHHDRGWHHWRSGDWHHGWHGGRLGWWWVAGGAWYYYPQPVYPYPDPYVPPTVVIEQPPAVVQVPVPPVTVVPAAPVQAAPAPAAPQFWYYCEASKGYYPYVATCPGGWKTVPATPSGAPQ